MTLRLPIFYFHRVAADGLEGAVRPEAFADLLGNLRALDRRSVTLGQVARAMIGGEPLPSRPFVLSFDDAYADIADSALPLMAEHGFRCTIFAVAGMLGRRGAWSKSRLPLMSAAGLRAALAAGHEVASHGLTHRRLTGLADKELERELLLSRLLLEDMMGAPVRSMAYPYGDCDLRVRRAARRSGYAAARSLLRGNLLHSGRLWSLPVVDSGRLRRGASPTWLRYYTSPLFELEAWRDRRRSARDAS